jgi:hypothetical protein
MRRCGSFVTKTYRTCLTPLCAPAAISSPSVFTLAQLEQAIRDSWAADTADSDNEWSPENPSCGQCDITSLVVHDLLGGDLLGADVYVDDERVEAHMWNRLPTGIEVDLTREQFRRGEVIAEPVVRPRTPAIADPSHPRYHRYEKYLVLSQRVRTRLGLPDVA